MALCSHCASPVYPNVMIGERRVWHRVFDLRHVALQAVSSCIDRAGDLLPLIVPARGPGGFRSSGRRAVAIETLRFIKGCCGFDAAMGVVASHTVKTSAALGVATALQDVRTLEPHEFWVGGSGAWSGVVALGTERDSLGGGGELGLNDSHVGEPGVNRPQVVASRPMTALAADAVVGGLGARAVEGGPVVGDVAVEAGGDAVDADRLA